MPDPTTDPVNGQQRTDSWPTHGHRCAARGESVVYLRFRGACATGARVTCPDCGSTFRYVKPKAAPATSPAPSTGRMHF